MANDIDGYGFAAQGRNIERLTADIRELDSAGVERVARGWDRHVGDSQMDDFRAAEQAAADVLEDADLVARWHEVRDSLLNLTEGKSALVSWKAEHGEVGAKAERAALAAALGLVAGADSNHPELMVLVRPMAEALPWLVLDEEGAPDQP
ncbi:MAG TPA: hypothetical protein VMW80_04840 [Candidatus Dormibacteraeota bacterium]|nr:hypothetical protein [Candidatus Dormibacteraeota bacterium]